MTNKEYSREDAQHIADQLANLTDLEGRKIFTKVEAMEGPVYHSIITSNWTGTAIISLRKLPAWKEVTDQK